MSGGGERETRIQGSQVGVMGDGATVKGGIHFGETVHRNVITIQNISVYRSDIPQILEPTETRNVDIGPNPYLGLGAFQEQDAERFFGREKLTKVLWEKFRDLHTPGCGEAKIRLLPLLGPSGSGKSSVARAGLIPALARNPLPGYARARVGILTPGTEPVQALAGILARMATGDTVPAGKAREFAHELSTQNDTGQFDGLARIAGLCPGIHDSPLVILADQFEEVYSLCQDRNKRNCFIGNLLHAASDAAGYVSVILTLRSDFLGETQAHEALNRVIAENGELLPSMSREELRLAVAMPARNAGHPLEDALVNLLVEETRGREGALPLLQFALTRIWEGMADGKHPADTLEEIGGVGGALAGEAGRLYNLLDDRDRRIVRRAFLGMVNLGEGIRDTRRRVRLDNLIAGDEEMTHVKKVLEIFSGRGARLVTLSGEEAEGGAQTAEMTHEALLEHWSDLKAWLDKGRDDLRLMRRLESAAQHWNEQGWRGGLLWRPPDLTRVQTLYANKKDEFSRLQEEFFEASRGALRRKWILVASAVLCIVVGVGVAFYIVKQQERVAIQNEKNAMYNLARVYEEKAGFALNAALRGENPDENFQQAWLYTIEALNQNIPADKTLPVSMARLGMKELHLGLVRGADVGTDARHRAFATEDKTVRRWESDLPGAFARAGKDAPEFKAVYRSSFDLFPYKMQEISLVPVKGGPPGGAQPWYDGYPRPAGKDPVQWMIESTAKAISEGKLIIDGIPQLWAASWMAQRTAEASGMVESGGKPDRFTTKNGMTFVYVHPGSFFMGRPWDELGILSTETFHMVTLKNGLYMQTTEVTQGQWKAVMGQNPSHFKDCGEDCPVESVSWEDVQAFIQRMNQKGKNRYRLPSEAEWEYACRAGSAGAYSFGDDAWKMGEYAWYNANSENKTHPVAKLKSNAFGLYDMHGNVGEWCEDYYFGSYKGAPNDGRAWVDDPRGSDRILRGGSWYYPAEFCRSAERSSHEPVIRKFNLGFRLVCLPGQRGEPGR